MKPSLRDINIRIKRRVIQRQQWDKWPNKQKNSLVKEFTYSAAAESIGSDTEGRGDHPTK